MKSSIISSPEEIHISCISSINLFNSPMQTTKNVIFAHMGVKSVQVVLYILFGSRLFSLHSVRSGILSCLEIYWKITKITVESKRIVMYHVLLNNFPISCLHGLSNTAMNFCKCLSTFLIFPLG